MQTRHLSKSTTTLLNFSWHLEILQNRIKKINLVVAYATSSTQSWGTTT